MLQQDASGKFNLCGLLSVHTENAPPSAIAILKQHLGITESKIAGLPCITFRFVDKIATCGKLHYLGLNDVAYDDENFYLVSGQGSNRYLSALHFDKIGHDLTITCEQMITHKLKSLLNTIVGITMLKQNIAMMHATAFNYNNQAILAAGWSKSGKTETLLAFMMHGAKFIADENAFINGDKVYGVERPIKLWEWHLGELEQFYQSISRSEILRLRFLGFLIRNVQTALERGIGPAHRLVPLLDYMNKRYGTTVSTRALFGDDANDLEGTPRKIFWVVTGEDKTTTVEPASISDIANRMIHSHRHQRLYFMNYYMKFCFAFPDRINQFIENVHEHEKALLQELLSNLEAYVVRHPHPVNINVLYEAIYSHV